MTAADEDMIRAVVRDRIARAFDEQVAPRRPGADRELRAALPAAVIAVLRGKVGAR